MKYIADLHIHSPFSRATSKASNLAGLYAWSKVKGINVVGTGDFTHPGWFSQLKEQLEPAEPGLFKLKDEAVAKALAGVSPEDIPTRFILTAEISSIYKRHDRVRKVHNILYAPDFASVERLNAKFAGIGNIEADGRPILGLDSRNLLEIMLSEAPEGFLVPAHIWTPWFSLFGSKSGFDAIEDCFGDLTEYIFALETGLSSDPDMNRMISALDRFALISNSDCHSPSKLGREANIFDTELSYYALRDALKNPLTGAFKGTIEFFPEEGKYHGDGHRKCQVCLEPKETRDLAAKCPVCGKPLTVGVLHRVMELADREQPFYPDGSPQVTSLIPLPEVLGEIIGAGPATKGVMTQYCKVIARFGSEFNLLLNTPIEEINQLSPILGEAIKRIRRGRVIRKPGYDGEFGVISVFDENELAEMAGQISMFTGKPVRKKKSAPRPPLAITNDEPPTRQALPPGRPNPEQQAVIRSTAAKILVAAGPGTGKTFTLVARIKHLLTRDEIPPEKIVAITFTNRAAQEMRERLLADLGQTAEKIQVATFHAFCLERLRGKDPELAVIGPEERALFIKKIFGEMDGLERQIVGKQLADYLEMANLGEHPEQTADPAFSQRYLQGLAAAHAIDLDLIVPRMVEMMQTDAEFRRRQEESVAYLLVDEFQDLNRPQYELVLLFLKKSRIFAIGDPNQAIYGFRGSDLTFFQQLQGMADVKTMRLIRNYRSAPAIIEAAAAVIRRNQLCGPTELVAMSNHQSAIELHSATSPQAEAEFIVQRIEELMGGISNFSINSGRGGNAAANLGFGDFAILVRLNQVAEAIGQALERRGIPFQQIGATPFYNKGRLAAAYRLLENTGPETTVACFLALLKNISGIGPSTLTSLEEALPLRSPDFFQATAKVNLPAGARDIIAETGKALARFQSMAATKGIAPALTSAMKMLGLDPDQEEAARLLRLAAAFGGNLTEFRAHLQRNAQATAYDERAEAVALMTMHGAKGLEFPVVFLAGLEEEIIPCTIAGLNSDLEEERRLFYVAMTRAKENLILTSAASRTIFNRMAASEKSRFISEIPARLIHKSEPRPTKKKPRAQQIKLF
ncbi:MAG: UvrD-helicase domain-containing protein [Desulfobulbaceae bacterium]|nr:UvrD-helicase domain-containing protein [Desulfobulbaceae bacterium]HIJ78472.1 UvrD-helicase domain-containing protein [Deltaproteobacteria bacterium]